VRILVDEIGVDHVDLNFGCPAPKVTRKGGGAALPAHPVLYRSVVAAAVRAAGAIPVTVKMRMGLDDRTLTYLGSGSIAEGEGAAAVTLHARTAEQRYSGPADWDAIARLKDEVTSIPVLGNGDIWEASDATAMMAATGCDGVVVGRGCLGRPWLFSALEVALGPPSTPGARPDPGRPPSTGEVVEVMGRHVRLLAEEFGENGAVKDFRKHTGWYLTGYPVGSEVRRRLAAAGSLPELDALLAGIDPGITLPDAARRLPRGHTDGPRPVSLPDRWLETADDPTPPAGAELTVSGG
jgi:nifR3 family TIM-barrel protein